MQPADILRQRAFPGDRHCQEQGVEPGVIEALADITPCREDQPFLIIIDIQRRMRGIPVLCGHAATEYDDVFHKSGESLMKMLEVILPLGQYDR